MKLFYLLLMLIPGTGALYAQQVRVNGKVTDASGEPLIGVGVMEKGTTHGVSSDQNGNYALSVSSPNATLVFSYIGYQKSEVKVNSHSTINVTMKLEMKSMEEVVVVGYGTVKRKDLTGAVSSVKGEDLDKVPVQNVASALAGRLAGVQVNTTEGAPGADISITIRGGGSITQSNEPLYVIDGIPQTDGLSFLDPTDIESIDVLKDAAATAIYGARGANGVVLVTTKQAKAGKTAVTYDMYYGSKKVNNMLPVLDPYQYTVLQYERSLGDATKLASFTSNYGTFDQLESLYGNRAGVNWQDEVFGRSANSQYHKIGISGGDKATRFGFFYSYNNDQGTMINSGARKNVAKLTLNHTASKKLKASASVNYSQQNTFGIGSSEGNTYFNQLQNIITYRPTYGIKGSDDDLVNMDEDPILDEVSGNTLQNPLVNAESQTREVINKTLYLNGTLDYQIINHLTYRGLVGVRSYTARTNMFYDNRSVTAKRNGGPQGSINDLTRSSWNYSNTLTYSNLFNKVHKLDVLVGQEQSYLKSNYIRTTATAFPGSTLGLDNLSEAATFVAASGTEDEKIISFFSRVNYAYKDKYLLAASIRADGSSKFGSGNKFGYFPAVSAAWRIMQEDFMKNVKVLSDLKLRLSVGTSGNNRIDNYSSLALLTTGNYPLNNTNNVTVGANTLPNPALKWEQTRSTNIGLDVGVLNQRIQLTVDAYKNVTKDLLLNAEVPNLTGYTTMLINAGSTSNKGLEFTLSSINIRNKDFRWTSNFNIAFNRNKVLALTSGNSFMYASSNWGVLTESDYIIRVGQPLGQMFGYQSNGLYQVDDFTYDPATKYYYLKPGIAKDPNNIVNATTQSPGPGYLKLVDRTGEGSITADDRTVIGNANPKFTGGLTNTLSYKNFDLSVFLNWSYGNDVYNANKLYASQTNLDYRNTYSYVANRWISIDATGQRVTDPATLAALNGGKTVPVYNGAGTSLKFYDQMVEDGSFLRINNISLGYTIPKKVLSKIHAGNLRVYVTGYNLYTFTKYSGYDPEVSTRNSTRLTPGVDFGAYPRSRSFVAGANLSF
ncbi:TonB-dependent receptor (plasmid) [Pedobacter sp. BS3]|uniref:SusC/RagA family TonB-linked outer membrane protein n=1 Tax=Pedobacter sp. BS3 TaxID=2567937 RepID=UPI0011EBA761|nr:TonB-dependent receptor [Pedobacter sp. BS3]TZF86100.1 TonB-dependent receptor [Pedobacter sp. BS3]